MFQRNTKDNENGRRRRDRPLGLSNRKGTNLKVCPYSVVFEGIFRMKKVIVITGASRGLGRALALRFAEAGFRVVVNYLHSKDSADEIVKEIFNKGGEALSFSADVRSPEDVKSIITSIYEQWGTIDILINNAAITRDNILPKLTSEDWKETIDTNLTGPFNTIRAASKYMIKRKRGHIINISSWSGVKGRSGQAAYSASKAGLIGLTRSIALELGRFNIQVNAVIPGFMKTDMTKDLPESVKDKIVSSNILNREQDMAEVVEFIYNLSKMNNVSGQIFNLDSRIL